MITSIKPLLLACSFGAFTLSVNATPTLVLDDGIDAPIVLSGQGLSGFVGTLGVWSIDVRVVEGSAFMKLSGMVSSFPPVLSSPLSGDNLKITYSLDGFAPLPAPALYQDHMSGRLPLGGTFTGTVSLDGNTLTPQVFSNPDLAHLRFQGGDAPFFLPPSNGHTIEQQVDIHHDNAGFSSFSVQSHIQVPDRGMTAGLLAFALVAIEGLRRKTCC